MYVCGCHMIACCCVYLFVHTDFVYSCVWRLCFTCFYPYMNMHNCIYVAYMFVDIHAHIRLKPIQLDIQVFVHVRVEVLRQAPQRTQMKQSTCVGVFH